MFTQSEVAKMFTSTFVILISIGIAIGVGLCGLAWLAWWVWNNVSVVIK